MLTDVPTPFLTLPKRRNREELLFICCFTESKVLRVPQKSCDNSLAHVEILAGSAHFDVAALKRKLEFELSAEGDLDWFAAAGRDGYRAIPRGVSSMIIWGLVGMGFSIIFPSN